MKELKTEKKTEGQTYNKIKSVRDSVGYKHETETDFVGSGYHPPERFVPLLMKISHPANSTQRAQIFFRLQRHYGNRYVQRVVDAYRSSQNAEEDESKLASEILSKKGSGRPLDPEVKEFMESRFGRDFSDARIHVDSFAARTAQDLGAEAFTIGGDVFFGAGRYNSRSIKGKKLIAHELTHVVQQHKTNNVSHLSIGHENDVFEREAREVSQRVGLGQVVVIRSNAILPFIQRNDEKDKKKIEEEKAPAKAKPTVDPAKLSGSHWCAKYPTSKSIDDLKSPFKENVQAFIKCLKDNKATVRISATYRPVERAYLMHWAYRIAKDEVDYSKYPKTDPHKIGIVWDHGNENDSKKAAQAMVKTYNIAFKPALTSRHTQKRAIDMTITGLPDKLKITQNGKTFEVDLGEPHTGQNSKLWDAADKYFKVKKLKSDPPHWSDDGH